MRIGLGGRFREAVARLKPLASGLSTAEGAAQAGVGLRLPAAAARLSARALSALAAEEDRWFLWYVVAFGAGIVAYFALSAEPSLALCASLGAAGLIAWLRRPRSGVAMRFFCAALAAAGLGFAAAKLRTLRVDAPAITREIGPVELTGRIESVDIQAPNRARIVLAPSKLGDSEEALPRRVRLTLNGANAVAQARPGAIVSALAVLRPPPEPAVPHGYDFARWAYFKGIGAVGFTYGAPRPVDEAPKAGLIGEARDRIERLRLAMTRRITAAVPGSDGAIAAALITGDRASISEEDAEAYRDAGLAHVLSISGLHLALAGLGVFWVVRALLALFPRIALTRPIKKWAAVAAVLSSTFYLVISGGSPPALRSYLMLCMMLLGVLADRPALSMRGVAMAALLLLVFAPEGIVDPGFQMSFAAVIGLIALAEWGASRPREENDGPRPRLMIWRRARRYVVGGLLASFVATIATTPFGIYHFDRAASYSLLANLLAEPVVAFVIMPAAALAVILMPFGLEAPPLAVMGFGVHVMTDIAHFVAGLPGAATLVRAWPASALLLIVFGGLWIALWRLGWRWFGLAPIGAGVWLILLSTPPDVLVARDGQAAAVRGAGGRLIILGQRPDEYTAAQWLLRDGDRRDLLAAREGASCDQDGCTAIARNGRLIALSLRAGALVEDCARAAVVIAAIPLRRDCLEPELVLDRFAIARSGALALTFEEDGIRLETAAQIRGDRPWSRADD